jgi:DeoR/GlpR family transcriptional regulator of sugar metabolism
MLGDQKSNTVKDLALELKVSEMTIRRDLSYLKQAGHVSLYHGGVSLPANPKEHFQYTPYVFNKEDKERLIEKKRIAEFAASLIEPFESIGIDNGTTCRYILDYMDKTSDYILYTYSMEVMNKAINLDLNNLRLFCFGGLYHRDIKMFESMDVLDLVKKTHITKLFFGAVGVSATYGLSCAHRYEIDIRRALMSISDKIIVLADSSKIDKSWFLQYGVLEDIDMLITDTKITEKQEQKLTDIGIKVVAV